MQLRLQSVVPRTRVAGPGLRALLHVQGCTLACPGCFNPQTHDPAAGQPFEPATLLADLMAGTPDITGLTVSGGEPLQQAAAVSALLRAARTVGLGTIIYSGYTLAEIPGLPDGPAVLAATDVLIDGRYRADLPCTDGYRGSTNQTLHFLTDRYSPADFPPQPGAFEAEVGADGAVSLRGFPDAAVRRALTRLLPPAPRRGDEKH